MVCKQDSIVMSVVNTPAIRLLNISMVANSSANDCLSVTMQDNDICVPGYDAVNHHLFVYVRA